VAGKLRRRGMAWWRIVFAFGDCVLTNWNFMLELYVSFGSLPRGNEIEHACNIERMHVLYGY
jgi:hypothetical protein